VKDKIVEILAGVLKVKVDDNCSIESVPEWDSLAHMRIIVSLEEQFNIEIEDEDLPKINSLTAILNYLEK
jgi:acyl carrier protein